MGIVDRDGRPRVSPALVLSVSDYGRQVRAHSSGTSRVSHGRMLNVIAATRCQDYRAVAAPDVKMFLHSPGCLWAGREASSGPAER